MPMIGIDEVGRGCWAGPMLVVAARQKAELPNTLKDSKKMTAQQRELSIDAITKSCDIGEGWVSAEEIDSLGLTKATRLGVDRALQQISASNNEEIIMDGGINFCPEVFGNVRCAVKADDLYPIVSAASVYAKVLRDKKMKDLSKVYPHYGFEKHVGYGTKQHSEALKERGACQIHRKSYKPVYTLGNL